MILVVVDAQGRYLPSGPVLLAVMREVKRAMEAGIPIVFLEYRYADDTHECLQELVRGYDKKVFLRKSTFGGGTEVVHTAREKGWDTSAFRLVGAETYCCVAETAEQLSDTLPDSIQEVVSDACFDKYVGGPFPRHDNIIWV